MICHVFGTDKDYFKAMFSGSVNNKDVFYYDFYFSEGHSLFTLSNKIIGRIPFLSRFSLIKRFLFFLFIHKTKIKKTNDNLIVFFGHSYSFTRFDCFEQLRQYCNNCKIVYYFEDTINYFNKLYGNVDLAYLKAVFDGVYSYNRFDAKEYNLLFHQLFYPSNCASTNNYECKYDVFFAGSNKGRLGKLIDIYKQLHANSLSCAFFINDVDLSEAKKFDGVYYNSPLSYKEVMRFTESSKAILEISTPTLDGITQRALEARAYGKILITDSQYVKEISDSNDPVVFIDNIETLGTSVKDMIYNKPRKYSKTIDYSFNGFIKELEVKF